MPTEGNVSLPYLESFVIVYANGSLYNSKIYKKFHHTKSAITRFNKLKKLYKSWENLGDLHVLKTTNNWVKVE